MQNNDVNILSSLKAVVEELGYSATLLRSNEDLPLDMLSIASGDDDIGREQYLALGIYPLEDLEGSIFVQFYTQYPFVVDSGSLPGILKALPGINNKLPLGQFNLSEDKTTLYFKYVLALPLDYQVVPDFLNDVLDMCIYAPGHFLDQFESVINRTDQ